MTALLFGVHMGIGITNFTACLCRVQWLHVHTGTSIPCIRNSFKCYIMCARKGAYFAVWLSFERGQIFLETVLQMLLICVFHFICSSTVTPSTRCFKTCSDSEVLKFTFMGSCSFWWLTRSHQHAFCFGWIH